MQQRSPPRFRYLLSLPPGYHQHPEQRWPLILFLYGAGEGGPGGLDKVQFHGVPRLVAAHNGDEAARAAGTWPEAVDPECAALVAESAITVSPQVDYSRHGYGWRPEGVIALLDEILTGSPAKTPHPEQYQQQQRRRQGAVRQHTLGSSGGGTTGDTTGPGSRSSEGGASSSSGRSSGGGASNSGVDADRSDGDASSGRGRGGGGGGGAADDGGEPPPVELPLRVDPDRVYVTGISMGGYGTWRLGASYPDRFAALAPVCGGADPRVFPLRALRDVRIWNFHGERDDVIPISASEEVMRELQAAGAPSVRFTRYPDLSHDSWTWAYNTSDLWRWMLMQSRATPTSREGAGV